MLTDKGTGQTLQVAVQTDADNVLTVPGNKNAAVKVALKSEKLPLVVAPMLALDKLDDVRPHYTRCVSTCSNAIHILQL